MVAQSPYAYNNIKDYVTAFLSEISEGSNIPSVGEQIVRRYNERLHKFGDVPLRSPQGTGMLRANSPYEWVSLLHRLNPEEREMAIAHTCHRIDRFFEEGEYARALQQAERYAIDDLKTHFTRLLTQQVAGVRQFAAQLDTLAPAVIAWIDECVARDARLFLTEQRSNFQERWNYAEALQEARAHLAELDKMPAEEKEGYLDRLAAQCDPGFYFGKPGTDVPQPLSDGQRRGDQTLALTVRDENLPGRSDPGLASV